MKQKGFSTSILNLNVICIECYMDFQLKEVFHLCLWCVLGKYGCSPCHCMVPRSRCRDCRRWGQRGRTPVLCRYTGWPLNCPQPESRTALSPARPSTWSPKCQRPRFWQIHPPDNKVLNDTGDSKVYGYKHYSDYTQNLKTCHLSCYLQLVWLRTGPWGLLPAWLTANTDIRKV